MPVHARIPSGRRRATDQAIGDETNLANSTSLTALTSGAPKDPGGFDQNGLGENVAMFNRAQGQDFNAFVNAAHANPAGDMPGRVLPRPSDLLLTQAMAEHNTGKVKGGDDLPQDDTSGTLPLSLQGLSGASYGYDPFGMPTSATFSRKPLSPQEQAAQRQAAQPSPWSLG